MPWRRNDTHAGFSRQKPWLPVGDGHSGLSAEEQVHDPVSVLSFTRQMLTVRGSSPALRLGDITFPEAPANVVAILRSWAGEEVICLFNLGNAPVEIPEELVRGFSRMISAPEDAGGSHLASFGVWIGRRNL